MRRLRNRARATCSGPLIYWELLKRREILFLQSRSLWWPRSGSALALIWPPTYLSEGKILVQSQQIPTESGAPDGDQCCPGAHPGHRATR